MNLSDETRANFVAAGTPAIASQLLKLGFRDQYIHGVTGLPGSDKIVAAAWTMRTIPAREDMEGLWPGADPKPGLSLFDVIESVPRAAVLVVDAHQDTRTATGGDLLIERLRARGASGIITDGCLRDVEGIRRSGLPSYCAGATANVSRNYLRVVEQNVPIGCGGAAVYPGDIVIADADGAIVVPANCADEVAAAAAEQELLEEFLAERIRQGASLHGTFPPSAEVKAEFKQQQRTKVEP